MVLFCRDHLWMADVELSGGLPGGARRRRSAVERRRIVEETLEAGASVARVALKYGVNANQVFQWRRLHRDGKLGVLAEQALKLLPVSVTEEPELHKPALGKPEPSQVEPTRCGAIHIELPGKVRVSLEGNVDPGVVRAVLKSLRS
jgi:transposase